MWLKLKIWFSILLQRIKQPLKNRKKNKYIAKEILKIDKIHTKVNLPKKGTLIIKCDDIGDYLVWQHTWKYYIQNAEQPVYFVGNIVWKTLFENFNIGATKTYWIDKKQWGNEEYRDNWYKTINLLNINTAITPLFTRNNVLDDLLIYASNASKKIAWKNNNDLIRNNIFTQYIAPLKINYLEYYRNIEFINGLFNLNIKNTIEPIINKEKTENILVIFTKANIQSKCWPAVNFKELILKIESKYDKIYLMGGTDSIETNILIEKECNLSKITNLSNKTTLLETINIINNCILVICPDTAALHIAMLTNTPAISISNGCNALRFVNYPLPIRAIYPPYFKLNINNEKIYYSRTEIKTISVQQVLDKI